MKEAYISANKIQAVLNPTTVDNQFYQQLKSQRLQSTT